MATGRGCCASIRPSIRWRCSLAAPIRGNSPRARGSARTSAFDEINLNVGCPSDRVQEGRFGACLMAEPGLVGECVAAMKAAVRIPVTVKCRIGIDDQDPEQALDAFAQAVEQAGADALIVHARKAWLNGLSPKENREVPPLDYARVYRLKAAHPQPDDRAQRRHRHVDEALDASGAGRWRDDGARRLSGAVAAARRRPVLFGEPAPFASPKAAPARSFRISSANWRAAHGFMPSRAMCLACFAPFPAPGRFAASSRPKQHPAPAPSLLLAALALVRDQRRGEG